jgi:hypothetical protein
VIVRGRLVAVLGTVGLLAAACSGSSTKTLDPIPIQRAIAQSILKQRGITTVVRCPTNAPMKSGYRFSCSAALDVGTYTLHVVELNAKGSVSYSNSTPLQTLNPHTVELAIQQAVRRKKHLHATVSCPKSILQAKGLTFRCTATTRLGTGPFVVTETNSAGHVSFKGL